MAVREAEPAGSLKEVKDAGLDREDLLGIYRNLLVTRGIEERGHILYKQGKIPGSFYTGKGNEGAAVGVATAMGLPAVEVEQARLGAILHDVGQIALRADLFTRGRLSQEEHAEVAGHPTAGARIVAAMPALQDALVVIAAHHERHDGAGYPAGLAGRAIPAAARAFQVADAYEAITQGRLYAARRSPREAVRELTANAGRQHDPEAVRALESIGEAGLDLR